MDGRIVIEMRKPCMACGSVEGYGIDKGGQDVIRCYQCDTWAYNRPKSESGRPQRRIRTRATIKPSQRFRILEQFGHACASCGAADQLLHIGHLISVEAFEQWGDLIGMTQDEVDADENLCCLCEECNLGMGETFTSIRLMLRVQRLRRRFSGNGA